MNAFLIFTVLTVAVDLMVIRGTVQEYAAAPLVFDGGAHAWPSEQDVARWDTRVLDKLGGALARPASDPSFRQFGDDVTRR
jgi:hypothetical protein